MAGISRPGDLPLPVKRLGRLAPRTDTRAADGDGKRDVILLRLQVDVLDEQRKQLSLRTPVPTVWLQLATFAPALRESPHPYTPVTRTFSVEAKGLEPSNLLTASQALRPASFCPVTAALVRSDP